MSIHEKLYELKLKYADTPRILVTEAHLMELFGEDFMEKMIQLDRRNFCFIFEENKSLYYVVLDYENKPIAFIVCNPHTDFPYTKMSDTFSDHLTRLKTNYIHYDTDFAKNEARKIDAVLSHPSLRLKQLFKEDKNE